MRTLLVTAGLITFLLLLVLVVIQLTDYFNYLRKWSISYAQKQEALLAAISTHRASRQATNHCGEAHGISLYYNVSGPVEDIPLDRFPSFPPRS